MTISDRDSAKQSTVSKRENARLLSEFEKATLRGDPIAVYQALLQCSDNQLALPNWLTNHLLELIADYHLGKKPSWKGKGQRPLTIVRRRLADDVRRRAVIAVRMWMKDKKQFQAMPTQCIHAWNRQDYRHCDFKNDADALDFASYGLQGIKLQIDGPTLKCSSRTLRRKMEKAGEKRIPNFPSRIASIFGLEDPEKFFGTDEEIKPNLK